MFTQTQPTSHPMVVYSPMANGASEKVLSDSCSQCPSSEYHRACHSARLRRLLIPAILSILAGCALLFVACWHDAAGGIGFTGSLAKRQTAPGTGGNNGTFVHNKLYLIIVFVGLFLVLVAAVMLSAWCCRGSFENPLCCPCYLCACCGGLACLDCIACGLCAEGLEQA